MAYSGCWYLFLMLTTVMQYFLTFLCWCTLSIPLQLLNTDNSLLITANTLSLSDKERALLLSLLSFSLTLVEQPTYGNCLPWLQHSSTLLSPKNANTTFQAPSITTLGFHSLPPKRNLPIPTSLQINPFSNQSPPLGRDQSKTPASTTLICFPLKPISFPPTHYLL